jgi:hypothetical protein
LARGLDASAPPRPAVSGDYFFGKDILKQIVE